MTRPSLALDGTTRPGDGTAEGCGWIRLSSASPMVGDTSAAKTKPELTKRIVKKEIPFTR